MRKVKSTHIDKIRSSAINATINAAWEVKDLAKVHIIIQVLDDNTDCLLPLVPISFVQRGYLTLNINPQAVQLFEITDHFIKIEATLKGDLLAIDIPIGLIHGVHIICHDTKESVVEYFRTYLTEDAVVKEVVKKEPPKKSHLSLV